MGMNSGGPKNPLEHGSDFVMTVIVLAAVIAICGILVMVYR
jgi:hypothetical protein